MNNDEVIYTHQEEYLASPNNIVVEVEVVGKEVVINPPKIRRETKREAHLTVWSRSAEKYLGGVTAILDYDAVKELQIALTEWLEDQ